MQQELDQLKDLPLANQLKNINKYLEYIFKGENPELYLEAVFSDLHEVYLLQQKYNQTTSKESETALQNYINQNINNIAKELRIIRKELIE